MNMCRNNTTPLEFTKDTTYTTERAAEGLNISQQQDCTMIDGVKMAGEWGGGGEKVCQCHVMECPPSLCINADI
jgi:hypothetical protein